MWNRFARFQGTFQVTANRITSHFASFFQILTERTDLRNRGHKNAESTFGERLKDRGIAVLDQDTFSIVL